MAFGAAGAALHTSRLGVTKGAQVPNGVPIDSPQNVLAHHYSRGTLGQEHSKKGGGRGPVNTLNSLTPVTEDNRL